MLDKYRKLVRDIFIDTNDKGCTCGYFWLVGLTCQEEVDWWAIGKAGWKSSSQIVSDLFAKIAILLASLNSPISCALVQALVQSGSQAIYG